MAAGFMCTHGHTRHSFVYMHLPAHTRGRSRISLPSPNSLHSFLGAVKHKDVQAVSDMIESGCDVNQQDQVAGGLQDRLSPSVTEACFTCCLISSLPSSDS